MVIARYDGPIWTTPGGHSGRAKPRPPLKTPSGKIITNEATPMGTPKKGDA